MTRINLENQFRVSLTTTVAVLLFFVPDALSAQRDSPATTRASAGGVATARGSGEADDVRRPDSPQAPGSLSVEQLKQIMGPAAAALSAAQGPWKVTPASPLSSKAGLWFIEAQIVLPGPNFAAMHGESGGVVLQIRPAAGEQHVIDCMVQPASPGYRIKGPAGFTQTFNNTNHLSVLHTATDGKSATFKIERAFSNDNWFFYACDVKLLQ